MAPDSSLVLSPFLSSYSFSLCVLCSFPLPHPREHSFVLFVKPRVTHMHSILITNYDSHMRKKMLFSRKLMELEQIPLRRPAVLMYFFRPVMNECDPLCSFFCLGLLLTVFKFLFIDWHNVFWFIYKIHCLTSVSTMSCRCRKRLVFIGNCINVLIKFIFKIRFADHHKISH